ncbi:MAG: DNA-binding domain-containing protein [Mariprofundales bacterium]|nr:DNA-binding domain-containing protein [Mariprofundales bacterium]
MQHSAPPSLAELQQHFFNSVMHQDEAILPWIADNGLAADQRMQIYRHIVENILSDALKTSYPATLLLVGEPFFDLAADRYVHQYPPQYGNLQRYGGQLSDLLSTMDEAADLAYLPDIARLEWARQRCYLAADAEAMGVSEVAAQLQQLGDASLQLHPSVELITSEHRIFDLWRYCMEPTEDPLHLEPDGQSLLLWRDQAQVAMQLMDPAACIWLHAILHGMTMQNALGRVLTQGYPEFALPQLFSMLTSNHLIINITPEEQQ